VNGIILEYYTIIFGLLLSSDNIRPFTDAVFICRHNLDIIVGLTRGRNKRRCTRTGFCVALTDALGDVRDSIRRQLHKIFLFTVLV